ncbi:hypothetical protein B0I37DRAFT_208575 [Chaetomium sp. MPI-CAGE-AT-0009]|nr:hypothetical protein B0I37DRAFT_208575 [Chaetomium sp. MPI-CAGE-AT-0009]
MPKGAKYRRTFFFLLLRWSPLDGTGGGALREGKLAEDLGRGWRRARRQLTACLPRYSGTYLLWSTRGVLKNINSHSLGGRRSRRAHPPVVDKGAGAVVVLGAESTCAQCALQNGPGSQIRGGPLPGPSGEQGLVLDQRMPSVGVELGDRGTT